MTGETDLRILLGCMAPQLAEGVHVFATLAHGEAEPPRLSPLLRFEEAEGTTLVLLQEEARQAGLQGVFPCRMITLNIHSSLKAVGFLAAILPPLAAAGIGVNPVSAYFHDHLFVPEERAEEALALLRRMAAEAAR
jgi:hypothetical protein